MMPIEMPLSFNIFLIISIIFCIILKWKVDKENVERNKRWNDFVSKLLKENNDESNNDEY